MSFNPFGPFHTYTVRARIYPALLASLPIAVDVVLWRAGQLARLWPLVAMAGGLFFLANYARSAGKRLEPRLIQRWHGMPTTHLLRHAEVDNPVLFARRRAALERVVGFPLPSAWKEKQDPAADDQTYVAAVRILITRVREQKDRYPRVHEENIHYGYRRNLLALKPVALTIMGILLVVDVAVLVVTGSTTSLIAGGVHLPLAVLWLLVVNANWVRQAGKSYAERLFETLEDRTCCGQETTRLSARTVTHRSRIGRWHARASQDRRWGDLRLMRCKSAFSASRSDHPGRVFPRLPASGFVSI